MARSMTGVSCVVVALLAAACSGSPSSNAPDFEVANGPKPAPSADAPPADSSQQPVPQDTTPAPPPSGSTAPVGTPPVLYEGTLAVTAVVPFGGSPYCSYDVKLSNVVVDVKMNDMGELVSATASDVMTESVRGSCPYPAQAA